LTVLGVNPGWHMHRISDGQRRRVQILLGLLKPARVLLLDEVTTDLDLIARAELLQFLREETEERGGTILYATHILDTIEDWATHIAYLEAGKLVTMSRLRGLPELVNHPPRPGTPPPVPPVPGVPPQRVGIFR